MSEYADEQIKLINKLLEYRNGNHSSQSATIVGNLISARTLILIEDEEYERRRQEVLDRWERDLTNGK